MTDKCPECGQYITPEATKELEDILDNLEEALINMKSGEEFDWSKAVVERYERKAKMYYSNHPKIKALLAEVDAEMANTEKRIKTESRNESIKSILSSRWTWFGVLVVIFLILLVLWIRFEITVDETGMGIIVFGFPLLGGGFALYNVAKWAAKGK